MSSPHRPNSFTPEELIELLKADGFNVGIAPPDDPIYQTRPRVRLPLPTAESLANTTKHPEAEAHAAESRNRDE